jgi:succinyl-CoA synthetase alpha subunit
MAVLVEAGTRVVGQGITGRSGTYHCERMIAYGTTFVASVRPGKGGGRHLDMPVFDTVREAVAETGCDTSIVFVPPDRAAGAMIEAIEAGLALVVCVTERIPVLDMVRVRQALDGSQTRLVGPNSQGVLAPGVAQVGVMTTVNARPGRIGVASRSASLTSEVVAQLSAAGLGQSTTIGVGGDPIHGVSLGDCVDLFHDDPETDGIVLIGEIGGDEEEAAAERYGARAARKPVVAYVAGRHAPAEQRMGHAGAMIAAGRGRVEGKVEAMARAGMRVTAEAHLIGITMKKALMELAP